MASRAADWSREISRISRQEPDLLFRSEAEVQEAWRDGRAAVRVHRGRLVGFLLAHEYAGWWEFGTGWVHPDHRRRGLFTSMHRELLMRARRLRRPGFGFPGNPAVDRALRRMGFRPAPYRAVPSRVWSALLWDRLRPQKLLSLARSTVHGTFRTSRRLFLAPSPRGGARRRGTRTPIGARRRPRAR